SYGPRTASMPHTPTAGVSVQRNCGFRRRAGVPITPGMSTAPPGTPHGIDKRAIATYLAGVVLAVVAITSYRIWLFHSIDPRMDQAFLMDWVQSIASADHVFPVGIASQSWLASLEADDGSLIHALLKPIYVANTTLFLIGSVAWFLFGAAISGISAASQFAWS